jgi:hypothetical protein
MEIILTCKEISFFVNLQNVTITLLKVTFPNPTCLWALGCLIGWGNTGNSRHSHLYLVERKYLRFLKCPLGASDILSNSSSTTCVWPTSSVTVKYWSCQLESCYWSLIAPPCGLLLKTLPPNKSPFSSCCKPGSRVHLLCCGHWCGYNIRKIVLHVSCDTYLFLHVFVYIRRTYVPWNAYGWYNPHTIPRASFIYLDSHVPLGGTEVESCSRYPVVSQMEHYCLCRTVFLIGQRVLFGTQSQWTPWREAVH